jgi:hypothetical protein
MVDELLGVMNRAMVGCGDMAGRRTPATRIAAQQRLVYSSARRGRAHVP